MPALGSVRHSLKFAQILYALLGLLQSCDVHVSHADVLRHRRDTMKMLMTALTLGIVFGSSMVQTANAASPMDNARMKAIQGCVVMEKKYPQDTWGVQQVDM